MPRAGQYSGIEIPSDVRLKSIFFPLPAFWPNREVVQHPIVVYDLLTRNLNIKNSVFLLKLSFYHEYLMVQVV